MKKNSPLRTLLLLICLAISVNLWAAPLHLYSLPYEKESGRDFSGDWSNKIVLHPACFNFDLEHYTYKLQVKTDKSVQVGQAYWNNDGEDTENWKGEIDGNGNSGEFEVSISDKLADKITNGVAGEGKYCIQFNASSGKLYYIKLVATERKEDDPYVPEVPIDFTKGLHTDGTRILDGNGNEFVMRGMNLAWTNFSWSIKSASDWGCNAVRLNFYHTKTEGWSGNNDAGYLEDYIKSCEENRLIAVPCPQDPTCEDSYDYLYNAVSWWIGKAGVMNSHVGSAILNIANEWYKGGDEYNGWDGTTTPRPQSEIDAAAKIWSEKYVESIKRLRGAGIKNLILIDVAGCGQGAPVLNAKYTKDGVERYYAQDIIDADAEALGGKANVAFSIHMYQVSGRDRATVIRNIDYCLALDVPCVLGEFAFEHKVNQGFSKGGPVAWRDIQEYAREKNVSWLAWSWSGNGGGAETCDMFSGSSLTENGKCMFYGPQGIKRTATRATIYDPTITESGLAYQYPQSDSFEAIHWGNGGRGAAQDNTTYEIYDLLSMYPEKIKETGTTSDGWDHYYEIDPWIFDMFNDTDKIRIKIGSSGQTAAYINDGSEHNGRDEIHLIGDLHEGKYNYNDVNGDLDKTIDISSYLTGLQTYGLRIDAKDCTLKALERKIPQTSSTSTDMGERWDLATNCRRSINANSVYFIPPTAFENYNHTYDLHFICEPSAQASQTARRAAGAPVISLYTSDNNGHTKNYLVRNDDGTASKDINEVPMNYDGSHLLVEVTPAEAAEFKSKGLYVGGNNFRLLGVKAISSSVQTGVSELTPDNTSSDSSEVQIFTLSGIRVDRMQPGNVYIVIRNGKASKVMP